MSTNMLISVALVVSNTLNMIYQYNVNCQNVEIVLLYGVLSSEHVQCSILRDTEIRDSMGFYKPDSSLKDEVSPNIFVLDFIEFNSTHFGCRTLSYSAPFADCVCRFSTDIGNFFESQFKATVISSRISISGCQLRCQPKENEHM